ncbi:hypothetical protein [Bifidobacterium samirii]|nr:hypothetical protein [Bifidobacterium samirii]
MTSFTFPSQSTAFGGSSAAFPSAVTPFAAGRASASTAGSSGSSVSGGSGGSGPLMQPLSGPVTPAFLTAGVCGCAAAVQSNRDLIESDVALTRAAADGAAALPSATADLDWQGNAASLFHDRLDEVARLAAGVADDADRIRPLAWGGA